MEFCYQHVMIATIVDLTMFDENDLAGVIAVAIDYWLVEAIVLGIYCIIA